MQRTSAIQIFAVLSKCGFYHHHCQSQPQSFLILTTCFYWRMMAYFDNNEFAIAPENSRKVVRAPYGVLLISYNAVRCPAGHRPMFLYTGAGWRPHDMWPRKRKFLQIVRCPGDYQIRRWCANRWFVRCQFYLWP